ncbi:hypothetical protein ACFXDE_25100 [Kitasatospora sp. NPDC059408]|uniref:hypothetical protein n=1 Tax=Kitasatospora sp. NPDC059408 TaxID=3346823 RepID=UPI0036A26BD3
MADHSPREKTDGQVGVLGIALGAVLAVVFAQGSWQWFSTYLGVMLLAVVLACTRLPTCAPGPVTGPAAGYVRSLTAYALVVGLCVAIALAPAMQRWRWLFPMPGTRAGCAELGRYQALTARQAVGGLAVQDGAAVAHAQADQARHVVDACLAATTTLWLPVYALGAAALVVLVSWRLGRRRATGSR